MSTAFGAEGLAQFVSPASFWRPELLVESSWLEHAPFAFWLTSAARPGVVVELGTHRGFSYFCFCQAMRNLGLSARAYSVDTWGGDEQSGFYGEEIFDDVTAHNESRYSTFSRLMRCTFDDALHGFDDASIDLLHIDGLHYYDSVRHDFEAWLPKLTNGAIVLIHDTNVRERGFGVRRFFGELSALYPTFEFVHGHGLGVVAPRGEVEPAVAGLFNASVDTVLTAGIREAYATLGRAIRAELELRLQREAFVTETLAEPNQPAAVRIELEDGASRPDVMLPAEVDAWEQELAALREARRDAEAEAANVRTSLSAAQLRLAEVEHELWLLRTSTSWRAGAPIRFAGRSVRSIRARLPDLQRRERRRTPGMTATTATEAGPETSTRPRIVFVSGEPATPGHHYRVENLAGALAPRYFDTIVMTAEEIGSRLGEIDQASVLWIWRAGWSGNIPAAIGRARGAGATVVFDVDDLMFRPELARAEIIDGIRSHGWSERDVARFYESVQRVMLAADVCSTTTTALARHLRLFHKPTFVIPNGFAHRTLQAARRAVAASEARSEGVLRIGYASGSLTHQRDLATAAGAIATVLQENPQARLVLFENAVDVSEFPVLESRAHQIEWRALVQLAQLPDEYARFDINIAPLEVGNVFCEAKSELKYFEAALAGVPTIASPTEPLADAIRHGETGLLAESTNDWLEAIRSLVQEPERRRQLADAAYRDVLWRFSPERRSVLMTRALNEILSPPPVAASIASSGIGREPPTPEIEVPEFEVLYDSSGVAKSRVAVVVPLYNYGHYIVETLESVRRQTTRVDVVVVDDCSTDESASIARKWLVENTSNFGRAALLRNRANSKLARSRNAGATFADTEFFLPLDADNLLRPGCVESALALLDDTGAAVVYPTIQLFGEEAGRMGEIAWNPRQLQIGNYIDAMAIIRRAYWIAVGGYTPLDLGWEDYDLWLKFVERGFFGIRDPNVTAMYRVHKSSMHFTTTEVPEHKIQVVEDILRLHPWLDIAGARGEAVAPVLEPTSFAVAGSRDSAPRDLESLLPLLRCPETEESLRFAGDALVSLDSGREWPIVDGRPVFTGEAQLVRRNPDEHVSNPLPADARALIAAAGDGLVLNLSAGGTLDRFPNVVEAEYSIFRHTDVVADAHALPFADEIFDCVLSLNAFEHYRDPRRAASEIRRVLKPGGKLFLRTAFLQPIHEQPYHFFNCTKYGLEEWLAEFEVDDIVVSDNFHPVHSLAWIAAEFQSGLRGVSHDEARAFADRPIGDFVTFWAQSDGDRQAMIDRYAVLPQETRERVAAGWQALARKPM